MRLNPSRAITLPVATVLALGTLRGCPAALRADGSTCRPLNESTAGALAWVRGVATRHDQGSARQRAMMRLSPVPEHRVSYVTDERLCRRALVEYNRHAATRSAETGVESLPSEQVCMVRVGTVFAVTDATRVYGEFRIFVTMDADVRMLAVVLG